MKQQKTQGNKWFEKTIKRTQNKRSLSEEQLKTVIGDALTYYLIESITFSQFLEIIKGLKKRPEIQTLLEIKIVITRLTSLAKFTSKPTEHRDEIIDTFQQAITDIFER